MSKIPSEPDDWSHESEALFRAARNEHAPSAADRARVRSALAQRLAASATVPAAGDGTQASTSAGTATSTTGNLVKIAVGVACVVVGTVVFMRGSDMRKSHDVKPYDHEPPTTQTSPTLGANTRPAIARPDAPQPRNSDAPLNPSTTPAPVPATPTQARMLHNGSTPPETPTRSAPIAPTQSQARPAAAAPALATRPPTSSSSTTPEQPVAPPENTASTNTTDARAELAFMARINAAMVAAKTNLVLALCAEHARRWPEGTFVQEREALRTIASCDSNAPGAAARARVFLTRYAHSPLAPRVRDECGSLRSAEQ